jgi:hypothetical protein
VERGILGGNGTGGGPDFIGGGIGGFSNAFSSGISLIEHQSDMPSFHAKAVAVIT